MKLAHRTSGRDAAFGPEGRRESMPAANRLSREHGVEPEFHDTSVSAAHEEPHPEETSTGADDVLGMYLKQMGSIPLLNRDEELSLAKRLELSRTRYRRAVLFSWWTIDKVAQTFAR